MTQCETTIKQRRLAEFLDRHGFDAVLLQLRPNFAWITNGHDNHIPSNVPEGVAAILATADERICFANEIEAPRIRDEELIGTGIEVVSAPWHDPKAQIAKLNELIAGRRVAADFDALNVGLKSLPTDFPELRWSLTEEELERYREGGARVSRAIEQTCREIKPGDAEHEIAGLLDHHVHRSGCTPTVTLVAADERIERFRHPIPTSKKVERYAMLVTCAIYKGLIPCITRFVSFGPMPELEKRLQAVADIDAAINLSTKPGRTLGELFAVLQRAYAEHGFDGEWRNHHQGGPTGYLNREAIAFPGSDVKVCDNQPFAWNPSLPGIKSEDTIIAKSAGIEVITACSNEWPTLTSRFDGQELARPGVLLR